MTTSRTLAAVSLAALLTLPACSKKAEPVPENETNGVAVIEDNSLMENIDEPEAPVVPPVENVTNTAKALPPPEVPDDVQIADDADATGLTARIDQPAANETQPAN